MKRLALVVGVAIVLAIGLAGWMLRDRIREQWSARVHDEGATATAATHAGHDASKGSDPQGGDEARTVIDVPTEQQTRIGLRTAVVEHHAVKQTLRAVGIVAADQRRESHVHTRIPGYIEKLHVAAVGDQVARGDVLYRLYSPDVMATELEYVASAGRGGLSAQIADAALQRLTLWGVPAAELKRLQRTRTAQRTIAFLAPTAGYVVDKQVLLGMYVMPEMELYHLADLSSVWVIVTLYEHELPIVTVGDRAVIELLSVPDRSIEGVIGYIYPDVDPATRTARARIDVANADALLKPGMYATATIAEDLGQALVVPDDAVIDTGVRHLVFVQRDGTRFEPREIEIGARVPEGFVVRSGLEHGEHVVVRANFLIDAESRLRAAVERGEPQAGHKGHG
jgi:Cu(I)/Ag(I) efflux system membrane fusion protein